jgi:hypothetical protein
MLGLALGVGARDVLVGSVLETCSFRKDEVSPQSAADRDGESDVARGCKVGDPPGAGLGFRLYKREGDERRVEPVRSEALGIATWDLAADREVEIENGLAELDRPRADGAIPGAGLLHVTARSAWLLLGAADEPPTPALLISVGDFPSRRRFRSGKPGLD